MELFGCLFLHIENNNAPFYESGEVEKKSELFLLGVIDISKKLRVLGILQIFIRTGSL